MKTFDFKSNIGTYWVVWVVTFILGILFFVILFVIGIFGETIAWWIGFVIYLIIIGSSIAGNFAYWNKLPIAKKIGNIIGIMGSGLIATLASVKIIDKKK